MGFSCRAFYQTEANSVSFYTKGGKSSILTALMVALGGQAKGTSRGNSVKSVILEGATWGEITVFLRNTTDDGYRTSTFGDHIRIVRRLAKTGASTYKIQNAEGVTVSTKRQDLQDILDHFAIDVMNPLCILTQEMAKKFLANSSDEEKYKFFLLGTSLQGLRDDIAEMGSRVKTIGATIPDIKIVRNDAKARRARAQAAYQTLEANRTIEVEIEGIKKQLAWCQVAETEQVGLI